MLAGLTADSRPQLASFVREQYDPIRKRWILQAPERIFVLDETSRDILGRCDGASTVTTIVDALAAEYDAPRGVIEHDVLAVLQVLSEKRFVIFDDGPAPD